MIRDAAGLLGLTALGAATVGAHRSWFAPLGGTLAALIVPGLVQLPRGVLTSVFTWQAGIPDDRVAAATAALLTLAGAAVYAVRGPAAD